MQNRVWLGRLLAAFAFAALLAAPGLPLPGADRLGLAGAASAQETIDIDTFYDELAPYGEWVWHPRYGYVWLPDDVSPRWRPYTVGRWTYTDEYGWYWDSNEPFAWAVYHYGRWGYDPDYGWFWVPGDTWAPAWVQWRYSDDYVGWAPVGPGRRGYAYGVPVSYEPPIAESWVFIQPRYMTSRAISHYALPIGGLSVAFFGATNVYRPIYRGGIVYNYGMPRDRVVKIIKRPIYVQKVYKVDNWKYGKYDRNDRNKGIKIYAPNFNKDGRNRGPKKFVDNPRDFKPKAKLHETVKGDVPKGWGKSAKGLTPIAKEDPEGFKNKGRFDGHDRDFGNRGKDKDRDKDKGQASKDFDRDGKQGRKDKDGTPPAPSAPPPIVKDLGSTGESNKEKVGTIDGRSDSDRRGKGNDKDKGKGQASKDFDRDGNGNKDRNKGKPKTFGAPGGPDQFKQGNEGDFGDQKQQKKNFGAPSGPDQFKQGKRDDDQGGGQKQKRFGSPGGPGPDQFKQGNRDNDGGGNQRKQKSFSDQGGGGGGQGGQRAQEGGGGGGGGDKKCQKHPERPECQGRN
jgi:hypothetical protein